MLRATARSDQVEYSVRLRGASTAQWSNNIGGRRLLKAKPSSYRGFHRFQIFRSKRTDAPNQSGFRDGHEILRIEDTRF